MLNRRFGEIYNSRSYSILLNIGDRSNLVEIYNSRNYSILLNIGAAVVDATSTTVEIILYYLTKYLFSYFILSTTVEIILYYLTSLQLFLLMQSTTVEIILYYLTSEP